MQRSNSGVDVGFVDGSIEIPRRPVAVLGYNTEIQVQKSITEAYGEQEARWNYDLSFGGAK